MTREALEELIADVATSMCDNYCKMTDLASNEEEMEIFCEDCPLDRLLEIRWKEIE